MKRSAVVLAAHGSNHEPRTNQLVRRHARRVRRMQLFDEVDVAFHQGRPSFAEVLDRLTATEITVVPVMTSAGYYTDVVLPRELARNGRYAELTVTQSPPIGTHPRLAGLVIDRVQKLSASHKFDPNDTEILVVGHGTPRHRGSRHSTEKLAAALQASGLAGRVSIAFLDEHPTVAEAAGALSASQVIVVPFLIGIGPHVTRDIPRGLGLPERDYKKLPLRCRDNGRLVVIDRAVGAYPQIADLIAELARPAPEPPTSPARSVLRLGTRSSRMARWQAEYAAGLLERSGARIEIVTLDTAGDRDPDRPIADLPGPAPFADDIQEALASGSIDVAVHSLKDLSVSHARPELLIAAVLPRQDAREALVSKDHLQLQDLPRGAVVGTSSPRRVAQLLSLRPDLNTTPLRGAVEDRVQQVLQGDLDAALLAAAGLERLDLMQHAAEILAVERFVPAPAQGALVLEIRRDHLPSLDVCAPLDHAATRRAVTAELGFLRPYEYNSQWIAAAHATCEEAVHLHARLIAADGSRMFDNIVTTDHPDQAAQEAIQRATYQLGMTSEMT